MKKLLVSFTYLLGMLSMYETCFAQEYKRNNNWTLGFAPIAVFNFITGNILVSTYSFPALHDCSIISDTDGNILFFSSGFSMYDKFGNYLDNGVDVNSSYGNLLATFYSGMGRSAQTSIIIPKKGNQYYVFSSGMSDSVAHILIDSVIYLGYDVLNYSVVDMDSNAGKGKVIEKNTVLLNNQRYANCAMTAVRHGNGKDWWLVKADCYKHQYQSFLVREDSILGPYYYTIPDTANQCAYYSEIYFSNDGTKFASNIYREIGSNQLGLYNRVDVFDFDRCTGQFTYRNYYSVPNDTTTYSFEDGVVGICFSPDSKLLYMSNLYSIYQIDIMDTNKHNGIFIHGPDDSLSVFPSYYISKTAPDGKLYIGNFDGTRSTMSYIDSPNVRGLGCNFIAQGVTQSFNANLKTPPNMPNYGLDADPCWPLQNENVKVKENEWNVYPNPASGEIIIESESLRNIKYELSILNTFGQRELEQKGLSFNDKLRIDISSLAKGVYVLRVNGFVRKVVKE